MTTAQPAVSARGLAKVYGDRAAVDGLSVDVPTGVVAGFIGPNGAGKTTTMAMLLGLVRPTKGSGTVLGQPLDRPDAYLGRVGALVEGPAFWPALTGRENLRLLARLGGQDEARIDSVLDAVDLTARGGDRFGAYSLGMKQRLGIAAALLGDPQLLVLDEPANGLDPVGMSEMRALIGSLADGRRTVLVSSHILSELEQVADWLLVIDSGRVVYAGDAAAFTGAAPTEVVLAPLHPRSLVRLADVIAAAGYEAGREADALVVPIDGADGRKVAAALNKSAADAGIVLAELRVQRPSLESHYLHLVGGDVR
jgi:ABC-2 type transport system ATP-binding protein